MSDGILTPRYTGRKPRNNPNVSRPKEKPFAPGNIFAIAQSVTGIVILNSNTAVTPAIGIPGKRNKSAAILKEKNEVLPNPKRRAAANGYRGAGRCFRGGKHPVLDIVFVAWDTYVMLVRRQFYRMRMVPDRYIMGMETQVNILHPYGVCDFG